MSPNTKEKYMDKIAYDYHNNNLVAEVQHFMKEHKLLGVLTDYEWLDHIAAIVNERKMQWGTTDCTTGLTYKR